LRRFSSARRRAPRRRPRCAPAAAACTSERARPRRNIRHAPSSLSHDERTLLFVK
jgi:hypothetical protein